MVQLMWILAVLVACHVLTTCGKRVCRKSEIVPFTVSVRKPKNIVKYGTDSTTYTTMTETQYRREYRFFCCPGYEGASIKDCQPICQQGCPPYSHCTKPNKCDCDNGYNMDEEGVCQPICSFCGRNSHCTKPEICTCDRGYAKHKHTGKCVPLCSQRCPANSFCAKPEYCECKAGYRKDSNNSCQPICTPSCGKNEYCLSPNFCDCIAGYMPDVNAVCQPVCEPCTRFSKCITPGKCQCDNGYFYRTEFSTECEPFCDKGCPELSRCIEPNECLCQKGYKYHDATIEIDHSYCAPFCYEECPDFSKCVRPDQCECDAGYEMTNDEPNHKCKPICSAGCLNGNCTSPDVCVCNPGYSLNENNTCMANCTLGCINGECTAPEICKCSQGYELSSISVNVCEPTCKPGCQNADCVAPNLCNCQPGYEPGEMAHICKPICQNTCVNGICTAPNQCTCNEGYVPDDNMNQTICQPKCHGCEFGNCTKPGECQCWAGYKATADGACQTVTTTSEATKPQEESTFEDIPHSTIALVLEKTDLSAPESSTKTVEARMEFLLNSNQDIEPWPSIFIWFIIILALVVSICFACFYHPNQKRQRNDNVF